MATIVGKAADALADQAFKEARTGDDEYQRCVVLAFVLMTAFRGSREDLAAAILDDAPAPIRRSNPWPRATAR